MDFPGVCHHWAQLRGWPGLASRNRPHWGQTTAQVWHSRGNRQACKKAMPVVAACCPTTTSWRVSCFLDVPARQLAYSPRSPRVPARLWSEAPPALCSGPHCPGRLSGSRLGRRIAAPSGAPCRQANGPLARIRVPSACLCHVALFTSLCWNVCWGQQEQASTLLTAMAMRNEPPLASDPGVSCLPPAATEPPGHAASCRQISGRPSSWQLHLCPRRGGGGLATCPWPWRGSLERT